MEVAIEVWDGLDNLVSVTGLQEIQRAFPWTVDQSGVVSKPVDGDELGFSVSKSSKPSTQKALGCAAAKLSRTATP